MGNKSTSFFANYMGLRIIYVYPDSPSDKIGQQKQQFFQQKGLLPFIDFVIGVETIDHHVPHLVEQTDMIQFINANENQDIFLEIYNILTQSSRKVKVNLNKNWPNSDGLLGVLFRAENYSRACQNIFQISKVYEKSPAHECQLKENEDYVLGVAQIKIYTFANFQQFIQTSEKRKMSFFICVFNSKNNTIRYCQILPNSQWGGKGLLGCEFNFGLMSKFNFNEDISKIKYGFIIQVDFFPPKMDQITNKIQNIEEKQQNKKNEQEEENSKSNKKQNQEDSDSNSDENDEQNVPKTEIASNMLNMMNQTALMSSNNMSSSAKPNTNVIQKEAKQQVILENKPKENLSYKYYSEKTQMEYIIQQDDLLDINIDLSTFQSW